jgi:hypothetical protein
MPETWQRFLLPKWEKRQWTWKKIFLLSVAVACEIDSFFFVPFSRDLDPGRSGEGILFLIIGFRALSRSELPTSVVVMGTCLAALTSGMNHGLLKAHNFFWMETVFFLLAMVMFWGRGKPTQADQAKVRNA